MDGCSTAEVKSPAITTGLRKGEVFEASTFLALRVLHPVMVVETPSCTATNSREFALNILSHIAELVKSDGFLIAVCGVWLCSMIAWWVL